MVNTNYECFEVSPKMSSEQLCLKWNNFESNIASFLDILRNGNDFVDVTITCENTNFKAHKLILSACSPYFKRIFQDSPCQHPVIILKNISCSEMEAILRYIYTGETHVSEENLQSFLQTANLLQIIGLAQTDDKPDSISRIGEDLCEKWKKLNPETINDAEDGQGRIRKIIKSQDSGKEIKNLWHNSKSHSSIETSEDERKVRNKSTESDSEIPESVKKSAEEKKKLWVARSKYSPLKKRSISENFSELEEDCSVSGELHHTSDEDPCPILSKQLLLPKKRKISSVLDQNKNVEIVSEHSDSSEADLVVKAEPGLEEEDEGEEGEEDSRCVLEPEVGLSVKGEPSDSEDSLPNGDILLQRLKGSDTKNEDSRILRVPNPDVSIFSQRLISTCKASIDDRSEQFTLAPNVDVFLRNSNNTENLLAKLGKINLFKAKRKGTRPEPCTSKNEDGKMHLTHLPCPHCGQLYNNLSALKYHVRLMHSDLENKLFCYLCPMNFIEREFFKMHLWEVHHARF